MMIRRRAVDCCFAWDKFGQSKGNPERCSTSVGDHYLGELVECDKGPNIRQV